MAPADVDRFELILDPLFGYLIASTREVPLYHLKQTKLAESLLLVRGRLAEATIVHPVRMVL